MSALSPLSWARTCQDGDTYSYAANSVAPIMESELEAVSNVCAERGLALFADNLGLRVETVETDSQDDSHAIAQYAMHEKFPKY